MNITKEVNFAIFKMRLVRVSPAIPKPNIFKFSKWFFFLCYEAQVLDLRKLLEFYYFQLSVKLLFFNVIHLHCDLPSTIDFSSVLLAF